MISSSLIIGLSGQVKQYGSDVAIAVGLLLMASHYAKQRVAWSTSFAVAGAVAVWFSHPAVFVLAGAGSTLFVSDLIERNWRGVRHLASIGLTWLVSFAACYALTLAPGMATESHDWLLAYWGESGFPPVPPLSIRDFE